MSSIPRPAFAEERRRAIVEQVSQAGNVRLADLVAAHGVSEQTIRKDLEELQRQHLLKRTHGGAIDVEFRSEQPPRERTLHHRQEKRAIARTVAAMISPGQSIFLDNGTTLEMVAEEITATNINVLTNAIGVARALADRSGVRHTLVGGQLRDVSGSLTGPVAIDTLRKFSVDIAMIGAGGLRDDGFFVADIGEAQVKMTAIDGARSVVLALDSSKFGHRDFAPVGELDLITTLVTERVTPQVQGWCDRHGTEIVLAH
ncbi:MAG: DeoR/GlpR family DNA-binding transcription regulator [Propioniciclava sp.]